MVDGRRGEGPTARTERMGGRRLRCRFVTETINRSVGGEFDSVKGREQGHDAETDKETDG